MRNLCVALLLAASLSFSQDYRGKLQGLVTDSSNAVVPGAKVTLLNDNTGVAATRESDASGKYFFDYVEPGDYTVSAEAAGFARTIQRNVTVQVRGDVTVNLSLTVGSISDAVTVTAAPVAVQFNTSSRELTFNRKLISELPVIGRNPFSLALLDPAVVNRHGGDRYPFMMWAASTVDVGGSTSRKNDLLLDGVPVQLGRKGSYTPTMDAVQETTVQQNAVDSEFGHSAGGTISLSMKSGTNEYHGTAYYFGRNPKLNAVANSMVRRENLNRNHIAGGTLGGPIVRNKLFNFVSYEWWKTPQAQSTQYTLPTELERTGDFSKTLTTAGVVKPVYDPWTTKLDTAANKVTRMPFPGNVIPQQRIDATARRALQDLWLPNNPGDNLTGLNNFKMAYPRTHDYWNFSDRLDWNINDRWKVYGRYSQLRNDYQPEQYVQSKAVSGNGGLMASRSIAADSVYTLSASTVLNFRVGYTSMQDDMECPATALTRDELASFWPNNPWYEPYISNLETLYYPQMSVSGGYGMGRGSWWLQRPATFSFHGKVSHVRGMHQLKMGVETRRGNGFVQSPYPFQFAFSANQTADTYLSPDTRLRGHPWASFLLGALDNSSRAQYISGSDIRVNFYGLYLHDDIRLTRRITLNLGLRYEYETGARDVDYRISRYLDLTDPIPEMQATPPAIPDSVRALNNVPYSFTGAWHFTDEKHPNAYSTPRDRLAPRAGIAIRLNDTTSLQAGFGRYVTPTEFSSGTIDGMQTPGFNASTSVAPVLEGIPGARLGDPFPASNPLILPVGRSLGRYTNLGDAASWLGPDLRTGINDRLNVTLQRQLPGEIVFKGGLFLNYGHDQPYTRQFNLSNPALGYQYKSELTKSIANPFYQYLTPDKFPGQLRNQEKVTIQSLLVPYPQYKNLSRSTVPAVHDRYRALQLSLQRSSARGYSFLWAYNYHRQKTEGFFNSDDQYADRFTFLPSNMPRHRMSLAGTYDLPFGRGRRYLGGVNRVVNAFFGGWALSGIHTFNSGEFLRFGQMIVNGDPRIGDKTRDRWFDTSVFQKAESFTPRTNPQQYDGLTGPKFWNVDLTLGKYFPITERVRIEFRMEAYNVTNSFIPSMPVTDVLNTNFGRSVNQGNAGRELQYTVRIHF